MIGSTRQVAVHAYGAPADMRKSFDSLSLLVVEGLGRDVLSGDLFLFVSRNRDRTTFAIPITLCRDPVPVASALQKATSVASQCKPTGGRWGGGSS